MFGQSTVRDLMFGASVAMILAAVAAAAYAENAPLPEGEGKSIVANSCVSCHGLDVVTSKKRGQKDWENSVNAMIDRGLALSTEQASTVVNYLARNFGGPDRGRSLVLDICSGCHEVEKILGQEFTRDEWWETIKNMLSEGGAVSDDEVDLILNYLSKNFGKKDEK